MKRERKKRLTPAELKAAGVSREIVVRKIRRPFFGSKDYHEDRASRQGTMPANSVDKAKEDDAKR